MTTFIHSRLLPVPDTWNDNSNTCGGNRIVFWEQRALALDVGIGLSSSFPRIDHTFNNFACSHTLNYEFNKYSYCSERTNWLPAIDFDSPFQILQNNKQNLQSDSKSIRFFVFTSILPFLSNDIIFTSDHDLRSEQRRRWHDTARPMTIKYSNSYSMRLRFFFFSLWLLRFFDIWYAIIFSSES